MGILHIVLYPKKRGDALAFLAIEKLDAETGLPIGGACYLLHQNGDAVRRIFTDEDGQAKLYLQPNHFYTLSEGSLLRGYLRDNTIYELTLCPQGAILLDGIPTKQLILLGYKKAEG